MSITPATERDLDRVARASAEFREHWASFRAMPFQARFDGTAEDIRALDYLIYEGLGYPPCDIEGASLIWGNIFARQIGFGWSRWGGSELLLVHHEVGCRLVIAPFARVLEANLRNAPQDDKYLTLTNRVIQECQDNPLSSIEVDELLQRFFAELNQG